MGESSRVPYGNLIEYYARKTRVMKIPFSGTLELTPRCNMNCKMCYIRMTEKEMEKVGGELPVDEWIRIAREAAEQGLIMVLLTGGEAVMYKDFKKLYLALREMGMFISINTNGTTITDSWIEFFKKYPPAKFNITIYGGSNETYRRLCGNPRGFDQLKAAIEKIQANGFEILLNCTITKQNVDDMEAIFAFGREHNLTVHATTYNFPPVRKEGVDDPELNRMTPLEAAKARVRLNWNSMNDCDTFIRSAKSILLDMENAAMEDDSCGEVVGDKVQCAAGRSNFWVTWDGRMLPCGMIPDHEISMRTTSFKDAWDQITSYTETIRLAPECAKCPIRKVCIPCAAKLKAETGRFDQKAEYKCEYTKEYLRLLGEAVKYLEHEHENS